MPPRRLIAPHFRQFAIAEGDPPPVFLQPRFGDRAGMGIGLFCQIFQDLFFEHDRDCRLAVHPLCNRRQDTIVVRDIAPDRLGEIGRA